MAETRFYHLQRSALEDALKTILERAVSRGDRVVVLVGSSERSEALSAWLWTYKEGAFLPHGTNRDGYEARQPVFLTSETVNPNAARILVQCDGAVWPDPQEFQTVCDMFDGNDPDAVATARERWKGHKDLGRKVLYFQQDGAGKWVEAARN
jgi:DNA polymerase-3 subunit chi